MGTIKTTNIEPIADNGTVTLGSSGDTFTIPSGVTMTVPSGGLSGQNYPAFEAKRGSDQSLSDNVSTKVQFDEEVFDTDNCYDNATNYRFTPNVAGKYYYYTKILSDCLANQLVRLQIFIQKNGSTFSYLSQLQDGTSVRQDTSSVVGVVEMNGTTDYLEVFVQVDDSSGSPQLESTNGSTYFGAYRIGD